ncbi:MAG: Membrane protein insertase YidC [Parcubacteria group bacterium GW2011_GWC2_45_7]|nr:MAG: Membrane protein insertase YidC [Parcubacteria group bacterium GW2011_GWC2_45_7]
MTVALRVVLIPFSIIAERNSFKFEKIQEDLVAIQNEFKDDPIARKDHIREVLRANRIQPWASAILLGIQLLALVLLYQVFVGGMTGKLNALYPSIARPDVINTRFLGFDIAQKNIYVAGLVGVLLYWQIWRSQRHRRDTLTLSDSLFRYAFPLMSFVILASLPAVKTIFILTSMAFSYIVHLFRPFFTKKLQAVKHTALRLHDKIVNGGHAAT